MLTWDLFGVLGLTSIVYFMVPACTLTLGRFLIGAGNKNVPDMSVCAFTLGCFLLNLPEFLTGAGNRNVPVFTGGIPMELFGDVTSCFLS